MKLVMGLLWLLHGLPLPVLGRLGKTFGTLLFYCLKDRRHVTLTNLALCFPEKTEVERRQIALEHFQCFARSALERSVLWWASEARLRKLIVVEPAVPMDAFRAGPVILLCPHFVGLDAAALRTTMDQSGSTIYVPQKNKTFDEALRRGRGRFKPVELFSRRDGIKPILRSLRKGLPFFMLPDMDFGARDSAFIPFFGVPAATLTALPRLAVASGAKVIPVIPTYLPDYRGWKLTFYPAWENYPGDDMLAATRQMNAFIEDRIRERPAEYFWSHRRFKTRPEGDASVY